MKGHLCKVKEKVMKGHIFKVKEKVKYVRLSTRSGKITAGRDRSRHASFKYKVK